MQISKINRNLILFLSANIFLLIYIISISIFNVPTNDDWVFLNKINDIGIIGFIKDSYNTWQGRFSYYFIFSLFLKIYAFTKTTVLIILLLITTGVTSFYLFIKKLNNQFDFITTLSLALFVFNISIIGALDFTSFFWICASAYYIILYATIFFVVLVLSKNNTINLIYIILASIIIGGGAESYTSFVILFFAIYILSNFIFNKKVNPRDILVFMILSFCFIIMLKAPGNKIRMTLYEQSNSISKLIKNSIKPFFQLLVYISPKFFIYIFSSLPFIYFGSKLKSKSFFLLDKLNFKSFLLTFFLLFVFFYFSLLPGIYATSLLTPLRALTHLAILSIFFFSFWGFVLGLKSRYKNYDMLIYITSISIFLYSIVSFCYDIPRMKEYKKDFDNRITNLNLINSTFIENSDSVVLINKLKVRKYKNLSSYTYSFFDKVRNKKNKNNFDYFPILIDEITSDPNDFRNIALKKHLKLKFKVKINDN